jgi:hypothetical protein
MNMDTDAPMQMPLQDHDPLTREHQALMRAHGRAQARCSEILHTQARRIALLEAQAVRLRAAVMVRETALAWVREDQARLERAMPGLSTDPEKLEASLQAADLVICQTGCLSHGAYWRVQDHCQRTGKACVLVEQPDALRIVRIHGPADIAADTAAETSVLMPSPAA